MVPHLTRRDIIRAPERRREQWEPVKAPLKDELRMRRPEVLSVLVKVRKENDCGEAESEVQIERWNSLERCSWGKSEGHMRVGKGVYAPPPKTSEARPKLSEPRLSESVRAAVVRVESGMSQVMTNTRWLANIPRR